MRTIEEIRATWKRAFSSNDWLEVAIAEEQLLQDIPDLLAAVAERDTEIEQLRLAWSEEHDEKIRLEERLKAKTAEIARLQAMIDRLDQDTYEEIAF